MDNCSFHYGQVSTKSSVSLCTCELLHFVFLKRRPTWISRGDHGRALARQRRKVEGVYSPGTDAFSLKTALLLLNPSPQVPAKLSGNLSFGQPPTPHLIHMPATEEDIPQALSSLHE